MGRRGEILYLYIFFLLRSRAMGDLKIRVNSTVTLNRRPDASSLPADSLRRGASPFLLFETVTSLLFSVFDLLGKVIGSSSNRFLINLFLSFILYINP